MLCLITFHIIYPILAIKNVVVALFYYIYINILLHIIILECHLVNSAVTVPVILKIHRDNLKIGNVLPGTDLQLGCGLILAQSRPNSSPKRLTGVRLSRRDHQMPLSRTGGNSLINGLSVLGCVALEFVEMMGLSNPPQTTACDYVLTPISPIPYCTRQQADRSPVCRRKSMTWQLSSRHTRIQGAYLCLDTSSQRRPWRDIK